MDHDGLFGPAGLLTDDVDKLQDALDGVDGGDAVVGPGRVVEVQDVPALVSLQQETKRRCWGAPCWRRAEAPPDSRIPAGTS